MYKVSVCESSYSVSVVGRCAWHASLSTFAGFGSFSKKKATSANWKVAWCLAWVSLDTHRTQHTQWPCTLMPFSFSYGRVPLPLIGVYVRSSHLHLLCLISYARHMIARWAAAVKANYCASVCVHVCLLQWYGVFNDRLLVWLSVLVRCFVMLFYFFECTNYFYFFPSSL